MFLCVWWKKANPPHLIWVIVELNLAIRSVIGLQLIVHPVPTSAVLDMLLQHRVSVYQEPTGTFRILSDYCGNCMKTKEKAACRRMSSQTIWWTDLPPQTYFLTNMTPAAVLSSITMMTVITMETVLEGGFFTCKCSKINQFREGEEGKQTADYFTKYLRPHSWGTDQKFWT